jgi:D-psicose/D-tagatose/L-ribulose 3-epimerase
MKIGFCMFLWTANVTARHRRLLEDIKATGYDGVEIPVFQGTPDDYRKLGVLLDRIGLERTAVSAMGDPSMDLVAADPGSRNRGIAHMRWAIDCTAALGRTGSPARCTRRWGASAGTGRPRKKENAPSPRSAP